MIPSSFDEANKVLGPYPDFPSEPLNVFKGNDDSGTNVYVSCWKPTKEEVDTLLRTGRLYLIVHGKLHPPVALTTDNPCDNLHGAT